MVISRGALALLAGLALLGMAAVEAFPVRARGQDYDRRLEAAELARKAMRAVRAERLKRGHTFNPAEDPAESGLIGPAVSPVTTKAGYLPAKQTSINPNFAAVVLDLLDQAGLEEGDAVAVAYSGSFPAINICVLAAIETAKARPIVISSASASQWGANMPDMLWIDMENMLHRQGILQTRSVAASLGGHEDRGLGMSDEGRRLVMAGIERNRLRFLDVKSFEDGVEQRMALYREQAGSDPIKVFINVGGGTIATGPRASRTLIKPGLNLPHSRRREDADGVMIRFLADGVPVIHLARIQDMADRYGLPQSPPKLPEAGQGVLFTVEDYNRWLALGVLAALLFILIAVLRIDRGVRALRDRSTEPEVPEPLV